MSFNMKKNLVLNYQKNFEDNLANYAYGEILAKKYDLEFFYENNTPKREFFENQMKNISLDYNYISSSRAQEASKKAYRTNFKNNVSHINSIKKNYSFIDLAYFSLDDINYINPELIEKFKFKNLNFIKNHDILDEIKSSNSIGLYISKKDIENNLVDYDFLNNALKRLNKYVKKPVLYVFTDSFEDVKFSFSVEVKTIRLKNKTEEFYFLSTCKHKIINNSINSYSRNLWAGLVNSKQYSIFIYKKDKKSKFKRENWLPV